MIIGVSRAAEPASPRIASAATIRTLVSPASIAVIGASDDKTKFGGRVMHYLLKHGFAGRLLPINPNRETVLGLPAYKSVSAAPEPPDVAIIAVPAGALLAQVEDCAAAGVGGCIVITGKLGEADAAGAALEASLVRAAAKTGMRLVGPNCLGIINPIDGVALTSSLAMEVDRLTPGTVGIVSQSGALMGTLVSRALDYGTGFSRCISVGNQADLELCDFLEYLVDDDATQVICLYVEGLKTPDRFFAAARRAWAAAKPILVVKAGRTEEGARNAQSHTASLAGSYKGFLTACDAAGVVVMNDPISMVFAADALARLPRPSAPGLGIAAIASSGGSTANFADQLAGTRLRLATMSPETRFAIEAWAPAAHVHISMDTGSFAKGTSAEGIQAVIRAFMADPAIGAIVYPMTTSPRMAEYAALLPALSREGGKPILFTMLAGQVGDDARAQLKDMNFPYFDRVADVLTTLQAMDDYAQTRVKGLAPPATRPPGAGPAPQAPFVQGTLTETETKRLVAAYGIPVTREAPARNAEAAVQAAEAIGYPVVVKGVARAISHKSDAGLVQVGLPDAAALRAASMQIFAILDRMAPGTHEGIVVQEMVHGVAELIVGTKYDPDYGPMVLVGFGGILVEVLQDVQLAVAPVSPQSALAMLQRLKFWPALQGVRGKPSADVAAAVDALCRLSWLAADMGPRLLELDINPLILRAAGQGAIAADGRATVSGDGSA